MKIYEKMGIDPTTEEGLTKVLRLCGNLDIPDKVSCYECEDSDCNSCIAKRLVREVPTKKRWQMIKSDEDLYNMVCDYICDKNIQNDCKHIITNFERYLCEGVEVENE